MSKQFSDKGTHEVNNKTQSQISDLLNLVSEVREIQGEEYEFTTEDHGVITVTAKNEVEARVALAKQIDQRMKATEAAKSEDLTGKLEDVMRDYLPKGR